MATQKPPMRQTHSAAQPPEPPALGRNQSRRWPQLRGQCTGTHTSTPDFPGRTLPQAMKAVGRLCLVLFRMQAHCSPGKEFSTTNSRRLTTMPCRTSTLATTITIQLTQHPRCWVPPQQLSHRAHFSQINWLAKFLQPTAYAAGYVFDGCYSLEKLRPRLWWHPSSNHHRSTPRTKCRKHFVPGSLPLARQIASFAQ